MSPILNSIGRWIIRLAIVIVALIVVAIFSVLAFYIIVQAVSAQLAYSLRPPDYPNSQLLYEWKSGGTDSEWDRRYYHSTDNFDQVLAFYEKYLPGFTKSDVSNAYINGKCNESPLSWYVSRFINEGNYPWYTADNVPLPCVSVSIERDPKNNSETEYHIWVSWSSF